jgi:microcystin-dependent protein
MARNYKSIAEPKTLSADVLLAATQITLNNVTGLPSPPYVLVLNPDTASEEVILVDTDQSGVTSPTLKVTRAIETGATAKTHTNGDTVKHMIVGSDLQLAHDHIDLTAAHGATGAIVGTTNTQTLTSKTLTLPKINENVTLTATATELNVLDGITASTAELNIMNGVLASTTELNYVDGVTSSIQTQIDTKAPSADPTFTGTVVLPSTTSIGTVSATEIGYVDGVTSAIQTQLNTLTGSIASIVTVPTGVISQFAGDAADVPTGWLLCDGSTFSSTTYSTLATLLADKYGTHLGTDYYLPNLKGKIPVGLDASQTEFDTLGETGGVKEVTLDVTQIPAHSHSGQIVFDTPPASTGTTGVQITGVGDSQPTTGTAGGGLPHNNLQPYIVVNYIIKF